MLLSYKIHTTSYLTAQASRGGASFEEPLDPQGAFTSIGAEDDVLPDGAYRYSSGYCWMSAGLARPRAPWAEGLECFLSFVILPARK